MSGESHAADTIGTTTEHGTAKMTVATDGSVLRIRLDGDVDLLNATSIAAALRGLDRADNGRVVLELSGITYLDSVGIALLVDAARRFALARLEVSCVAPADTPAGRILRLTGLEGVLGIAPGDTPGVAG